MITRRQIVEFMNRGLESSTNYELLKKSIILEKGDINEIDKWFDGCMTSLFWRPNPYALVLVGRPNIGKSHLVRNLVPQKEWFYSGQMPDNYQTFLVDLSDCDSKTVRRFQNNDGFRIYNCSVDKRLANFVITANTPLHYEQRKSFIILHVKEIDKDLFNSIDKEQLWIEIWHRFGSRHHMTFPLTQKDINEYYG